MGFRNIAFFLLIGLIFVGVTASGSERNDNFISRNQIGIRLGAWANQGDEIPDLLDTQDIYFESKVKGTSFYFEGYYAHRILKQLLAELSVGVANRGSVTIEDKQLGITDFGNLMVYPILISARIYPMASADTRIQPFVSVGGGIYYGRQTIQISNVYFDATYRERSATDWDIALSGGFDWLLGSNLGLEFRSSYHPIHFAKPLLTAKEYDALSVTIGIKYFYKPKQEK